MLLAQLDPIYRAGYLDPNLGTVQDEDIQDLRRLLSLVDPELFTSKSICILNPTFGVASHLVGGADADLVIDGALIDVKTTVNLQITRAHYHQLVGYYTLHRIGGISGFPSRRKITHLGIYFSRHAYLHMFRVRKVVNEEKFVRFASWFEKTVRKYFSFYETRKWSIYAEGE